MLKNFLMRKLMESKMKNVPPAQREQIISMMEKNPELFKKIGKEVEARVKGGKDQVSATMEVMRKHQHELRGML